MDILNSIVSISDVEAMDLNSMVTYYNSLLTNCIVARYSDITPGDTDKYILRANRCTEWLATTDFYAAPASTRYHESEPGGLLKHTLKVVARIKDLLKCDVFKDVSVHSAVLVALVHDWCKIGLYESYNRNIKDSNGNWTQVMEFKYKELLLTCFGHGVSSMFLIQRFVNLSVEEALAIRWHMGAWRVVDSEMNELQQSNETYPLVHLLQFADQLSIVSY